MTIWAQSESKIVETCILDRQRLDFEGPWPRFWRVWASILDPPDLILDALGAPHPVGKRQTCFLYPFLCAATGARSGTLPTATWISLSGAKFDPEADFDVRFAVARQNPRQIGKKQKFSSEIFAPKIFFWRQNIKRTKSFETRSGKVSRRSEPSLTGKRPLALIQMFGHDVNYFFHKTIRISGQSLGVSAEAYLLVRTYLRTYVRM